LKSDRAGTDARDLQPLRAGALYCSVLLAACVGGWAAGAQEHSPSPADVISGTTTVIDADILRFGEQRVILWGVDAPEPPQKCSKQGKYWNCNAAARRFVETMAGRGEVRCRLMGEADPLGRRYGVCESGEDVINDAIVRAGLALAYTEQTDAYEEAQLDAIQNERGLWAIGVEFIEPWAFREMMQPGGLR